MKTWGSFYTAGALSFNTFRNDTLAHDRWCRPDRNGDRQLRQQYVERAPGAGLQGPGASWLAVTPFVAVQFSELRQNGFTETNVPPPGAGVLGLSYASRTVSSLPTFVGTQVEGRVYLPYGVHPVAVWTASPGCMSSSRTAKSIPRSSRCQGRCSRSMVRARHAMQRRVEVGSKLAINRYVKAFVNFDGEYSQTQPVLCW